MKDMKMVAMIAAVLAIVGIGYYYMNCHKIASVKIQAVAVDKNGPGIPSKSNTISYISGSAA
ncbi:hypothetical protein [Candidatus Chromulinivorax destructor]|uniref:Uncharacterized protein n=1 Tax=Candidatus Chromulinivorax destructor TaxID=2066483 RepID=A0A345ZAT5_9BACT|nr:hypothetical protein [Candidatus Chromulinivorax destructor]AXK60402.1 hypothetical protein C0J27_01400 [Candidatus Chromulinivorax destructor]